MEKNELFSTLVEHSPSGILVTTGVEEKVEFMNQQFTRMFGYSTAEVPDVHHWWRLAYPDSEYRAQVSKEWESRVRVAIQSRSRTEPLVTTVTCKNGTKKYVEFTLVSIGAKNLVFCRDLTDIKTNEVKLQSSNAVLKGILDSFENPLFSVDLDYRYTSFNNAHAMVMKALYGKEIEIGKSILEYQTVEDDRIKSKRNLDRCLRGERVIEAAFSGEQERSRRYFEVDHIPIWDVNGIVKGVTVYARDSTREKHAREQVESLSRFPSENPNPVIRVSPDGMILYSNSAASQKDTWGCIAGDIISPPLKEGIKKAWDENRYIEMEARFQDLYYSIGIAPVVEYGYLNVYGRDITDYKQAQQSLENLNTRLEALVADRTRELVKARDQLVRNEKLAVIGKLAGSISHELRNPLTTINNAIFFLKTKLEKGADEKTMRHMMLIEQEVQRSRNIISDMLAFSRLKVPTRSPMDVNELLATTITSLEIPKNILVQKRFGERLPLIRADKGQMQQVFFNVLSNGIESMADGGKLEINTIAMADCIIIEISDMGTGILPEHAPYIFEPLFTTKVTGIGLGLALVKEIVEKHDGNISFESKTGSGTTFKITLPIDPAT